MVKADEGGFIPPVGPGVEAVLEGKLLEKHYVNGLVDAFCSSCIEVVIVPVFRVAGEVEIPEEEPWTTGLSFCCGDHFCEEGGTELVHTGGVDVGDQYLGLVHQGGQGEEEHPDGGANEVQALRVPGGQDATNHPNYRLEHEFPEPLREEGAGREGGDGVELCLLERNNVEHPHHEIVLDVNAFAITA